MESLPHKLVEALREHNSTHLKEERIRLRMTLHAGEITYDDQGVAGASINLAFRLLDAAPLKTALADSPGVLALITSSWFFDEVVRHSLASNPATYRPVRVSVKETTTTGWICLPDHPYPPDDTNLQARPADLTTLVPRQLPAHTPHFVGRDEELRQLSTLLDTASQDGGTVVISAIDGTAGIGKTALAVHWAHQAADLFPDGQLYVNLRGFDPTGEPMQPAEAVRGFLDAFEIAPERIPVNLDAQAALYRSLLADRHVLVVLDNARDTDQVRPLLPGSPTCRVVITSRNQLASLVTHEGARLVTLDVLRREQATALLVRHLGHDHVTAEPDVVTALIDHCARLPLALAIVAARAALNPCLPLRVLADELRDEQTRLDALDAGDPSTSVRAVFSWSYQHLNAPAARMFRLLGVHPGPDISLPAAASLAGIPLNQAREALGELTRVNLLSQHTPGRFTFHDLLRAYATDQAHTVDTDTDTDTERRAAMCRVLDFYLHTAHTADRLLNPHRHPITVAPPHPGVIPEDLADDGQTWAWCEAERPVLLAAIAQAASAGFDTHAWQIPWSLATFFDRQGYWHDYVASQRTALAAARRLDDRGGQARAHRGLGWVFVRQHRHGEALGQAQQALDLYRAAGHRVGQAIALNSVGWVHALLGNHQRALTCCEQALTLHRELDDRQGMAETCDSLGYAHHRLGHHPQALAYYQQALTLRRELGDRYNQADTLTRLGNTHHAAGNPEAARDTWQQALTIFEELGHSDADQVRGKLTELDQP